LIVVERNEKFKANLLSTEFYSSLCSYLFVHLLHRVHWLLGWLGETYWHNIQSKRLQSARTTHWSRKWTNNCFHWA